MERAADGISRGSQLSRRSLNVQYSQVDFQEDFNSIAKPTLST